MVTYFAKPARKAIASRSGYLFKVALTSATRLVIAATSAADGANGFSLVFNRALAKTCGAP